MLTSSWDVRQSGLDFVTSTSMGCVKVAVLVPLPATIIRSKIAVWIYYNQHEQTYLLVLAVYFREQTKEVSEKKQRRNVSHD